MSKNLIIILLVLIMFFCSSCSIGGSRIAMLNKSNEEEIADAMMEEIVSIINDEDKEALFANDVLAVAENFDSDFDDLIDFIQGDIKSWERKLWHSSEKTRKEGDVLVVSSWFFVKTDKMTYLFFLSDTTEDTIDINNQGLSILQVIKEEDAEITQWQDNFLEGIHIFDGSTESNK